MLKKLMIVVLCLTIVLTCAACTTSKEDPQSTLNVQPAEYMARSYKYADWHVEGTKDYYNVFAVYSGDYYAHIENSDILYLNKNGEYELFRKAYPASDITIVNVNDSTHTGVGAYVQIRTNQLIDINKVFIQVEGPVEYSAHANSKTEYIRYGGKEEDWRAITTSISSKSIPYADIAALTTVPYEGLMNTVDGQVIYVTDEEYESGQTEDSVYFQAKYMAFTEINFDTFTADNVISLLPAYDNDGGIKEAERNTLDDNLELFCELGNMYVKIGYKTKDGSDISQYLDVVPKYVKYSSSTELLFPMFQED